MSGKAVGALVALAFVVAGCGGGTPAASPSHALRRPEALRSVQNDAPLRRAAERWLRLLTEGRRREVYHQLVSQKCHRWESLDQFRRWTRLPASDLPFVAYRGGGNRGYVAWIHPTTTPPAIGGVPWPWVLERGAWRSDSCPRPDPGAR